MKRIILSLLILTLPALAGLLRAQSVTYRFTRHYNERVALFEQLQDDIDSTTIVMLGNSLTENGGDWNTLLGTPEGTIVNRGISGDDARGITARLVQILPHRPKAIFLMCGTNDLSHQLTATQVFQKCKGVIDSIRAAAPLTQLYVQSLLPINEGFRRWKSLRGKTNVIPVINRQLRAYCDEQDIPYVDLFPRFTNGRTNVLRRQLSADGLHLSRQGYQVWADALAPYIEAIAVP